MSIAPPWKLPGADGPRVPVLTTFDQVARVLGKLGLRDRIQAVILAYESGLVRPSG